MSKSKNIRGAFVATMENLELVQEPLATPSELVEQRAEIEREIVADELEQQSLDGQIENTVQDIATLESLVTALKEHRDVGMEMRSAQFMHIGLAPLQKRYNDNPALAAPAMESFSEPRQARLATTISLESVSETLTKAWQWLQQLIAKLWEAAKDLYQKFRQMTGAQERHAKQLLAQIQKEGGHVGKIDVVETAATLKVIANTGNFDPERWARQFRSQFSVTKDFTKVAMKELISHQKRVVDMLRESTPMGRITLDIPVFTLPPVTGLNYFKRDSGTNGRTDVYPSGEYITYEMKTTDKSWVQSDIEQKRRWGNDPEVEVRIVKTTPTSENVFKPQTFDVTTALKGIVEFYKHQEIYLNEGQSAIDDVVEAIEKTGLPKLDEKSGHFHERDLNESGNKISSVAITSVGRYFKQNKRFFEALNAVANRSMGLLLEGCDASLRVHLRPRREQVVVA